MGLPKSNSELLSNFLSYFAAAIQTDLTCLPEKNSSNAHLRFHERWAVTDIIVSNISLKNLLRTVILIVDLFENLIGTTDHLPEKKTHVYKNTP